MERGTSVRLAGANVEATAEALVSRLRDLQREVEVMDTSMADRLGPAAALVCQILARNGIIVIVAVPEVKPDSDCIEIVIDPKDTPDFAAEKILDALAGSGVVTLALHEYSAEDEEIVRRRLAELGYIE